jgi:hypothetical protein
MRGPRAPHPVHFLDPRARTAAKRKLRATEFWTAREPRSGKPRTAETRTAEVRPGAYPAGTAAARSIVAMPATVLFVVRRLPFA